MKPEEFLSGIANKLGYDDIMDKISEESVFGTGKIPEILVQCQEYIIKLNFINLGELVIEINYPPPHFLLIKPTNWLAKLFPFLFLDIEIGEPEFDDKYLIQNTSYEKIIETLTPDFREIIQKLAPFIKFEMTYTEYRIYKYVDIEGDYTIERGMEDINNLVKLVSMLNAKKRITA